MSQSKTIEVPVHVGLAGEIRMQVRHADGVLKSDTGWFHNTILNAGLDRMGSGAWIQGCAVGTGNSTPTTTQTSLDNRIAYTINLYAESKLEYVTAAPYYGQLTRIYRFGPGVAAGNLSEVGLGWGSPTYAGLFCRQLIKDTNGNATTITVLASEILDVTYRLRLYLPADNVYVLNISGSDYTVTVRPANFNTPSYIWACDCTNLALAYDSSPIFGYTSATSLDTVFGSLVGETGQTDPNSATVAGYAPGSYKRSVTAVWNYTRATAGLEYFTVYPTSGFGRYQVQFSPRIPKDNTNELTLTVSYTWGRYP